MNTKKGVSKILLINFLLLAVLLFCVEIVLRILGLGYDSAAFEPNVLYHHAHKKNYSFINNNPSEKEYSNILVRYDKDGCVSNPNPVASSSANKKIAILGDSYAEGLQVDFNNSITGILQKQLGKKYEIKNFAVGGYSPVIYFLQCKYVLQEYRPDFVFLLLYSNDLREDKDFLTNAVYNNNTLVAINGGVPAFKYSLIRKSYLLRFIRKYYIMLSYALQNTSQNNYVIQNSIEEKPLLTQPTLSYLDSIRVVLAQSNCKLIVSAVPSKYKTVNALEHDSLDFATQCRHWAAQNKTSYVDLTLPFINCIKKTGSSPFFKNDIHFNEAGHSVAAVTIANYFNKQ